MDTQKQYSLLMEAFNAVYDNISESHFKVGDEVICKKSGMEGEVVKVDSEEKGKYYTVKREDGKTMKYAPDELKLEKEDKKEDMKEAKNGGVPKKKEEKFHTKLDKLVHSTFGSSPEEMKMKEEVDIFDVILEHLVAEGYADTNQAALVIMANMGEEWKKTIFHEATRYAKETGKSFKSGEERVEGGSMKDDEAFKSVSKMMRGQGRPKGQNPKVKGKKPPAAGEFGGPESPAQKVAKRRAREKRSRDMMTSRFD